MSNNTVTGNALSGATPNSGEKTGLLEKFSFSLLNFGVVPGLSLINGALLLFYTDVVGLDPAKIGLMFLVARVFDGVNDPIQGYIIDHLPRMKMGRFRPYLIMASFLFSINFALVFFGPLWFSGAKMVVAWITYLLIDMSYSFLDIPNNCMFSVITDHPKDRNILVLFKAAAMTLGGLVVGMPLPLLLDAMPDDKLRAFYLVVGMGVAITTVCVPLGTLGIKERIPAEKEQAYGLRDLLPMLIQRPVYALFLANLLLNISNTVVTTSSLYFFTYVMKDLTLLPVLSLVSMVCATPSLVVAPLSANRFGKRSTFTGGMLIMFAGYAARLLNIYSRPLLFFSAALSSFGASVGQPLTYGIIADNTDYIEYSMDKRAEGAIASLNTLGAKASGGIGGALSGYILNWTGYVPNADPQTKTAQNGIISMSILFPLIASLAAALIFRFLYPLTNKRMEEITLELQERRAAREEITAETPI